MGAEIFHALKNGAARRRATTPPSATRAASRPTSPATEEALELHHRGRSRRPATSRARTSASPSTPPPPSSSRTASYVLEGEGKTLDAGADGRLSTPTWSHATRSSRIEDGMAEDDWDGWKLLTERPGRQGPARRRRPVRHQPRAPEAGHRRGHRQLDPDQGQPDRHPDRDARRHRDGPARRLHRRHLAPLGRDRGHHHRRPRRGHQLPARSRPARCRRTDRVAKYNQLLRIEEELGDQAVYAGVASR